MNKINETFRTSDIHEAVCLRCSDYDIKEFDVQNGKVYFVFENTAELHKTMLDYTNCKVKIEAKRYKNELESLRSMIKSLLNHDK
jgi:uncharacterized pyridoxamine 5'-phosphate oxidase family protein